LETLDIVIAPIYFVVAMMIAYLVRNRCTDSKTRSFFISGLLLKIIGAVAAGCVYQFYYDGGDTFNFYNNSKIMWQAFKESPGLGMKVLFARPSSYLSPEVAVYVNKMYFFGDKSSMGIIRLCTLVGLFTFHTYTGIAIIFACLSFSGLWALYLVFYDRYPTYYKPIGVACFFIPSVFFWGSGIFKDSITLGALGWLLYGFYFGIIKKENLLKNSLIAIISVIIIINVKVYIILCMLPGLFIVFYIEKIRLFKYKFLKILIGPILITTIIFVLQFFLDWIAKQDQRYAIESIAVTSKITAEDIRFVTGKDGGSGYTLGKLDGTFYGMLRLAPQAINVSLFRPYIWEIKNFLMLLSSLESTFFLILTIIVLVRLRLVRLFYFLRKDTWLLFCLLFTLTFAFGVGVSSFNFGTLSRYKLPLMPFFAIFLFILLERTKKIKNSDSNPQTSLEN